MIIFIIKQILSNKSKDIIGSISTFEALFRIECVALCNQGLVPMMFHYAAPNLRMNKNLDLLISGFIMPMLIKEGKQLVQ